MITSKSIERHAGFQKTLLQLMERCEDVFSQLNRPKIREIADLKKKVLNENLKVVVLGSFSRGKSTFINAMLGEEILPSFATPCTAVINEIKWGEEKKAIVFFRNIDELTPLQKIGLASLPEKAREHLKRFRSGEVAPLEIGIDELEDYVVIKNPGNDAFESTNDLPYDHVEIFWPLPLLKNGVVIIDSPGLDECQSRIKITERYLRKADAILFVLSCTVLAGQSEMDFIDNMLINNGYEDMLFVCNRFDEVREREQERIVAYGRKKLGAKTNFGAEDGVFFLSAAEALEGRLKNDIHRITHSGILELERRLNTMLVSSRGKTKLIQPTRLLAQEINQSSDDLHTSRSVAQGKIQGLRYRLKEFKRHAEREILGIHHTLEKLQEDLKKIVQEAKETIVWVFQNHFAPIVGQSILDYTPQNSIGLGYFFSEKPVRRKRIHEVAREIKQKITSIFEENQQQMLEFLQSDIDNRNVEAEDFISLTVERIVDSVLRLQATLEEGESTDSGISFDVSSIRLDNLPKLSDAKTLVSSRSNLDIVKSFRSAGIDGKGLHERSASKFFDKSNIKCDYFKAIDSGSMDHILSQAGFPYDDASKDTAELKIAIGEYYCGRLLEQKDTLLESHTRNWEKDIDSFIGNIRHRTDQRIEEIKVKATERYNELSDYQRMQSVTDESFNMIREIRLALSDLIYDLAAL